MIFIVSAFSSNSLLCFISEWPIALTDIAVKRIADPFSCKLQQGFPVERNYQLLPMSVQRKKRKKVLEEDPLTITDNGSSRRLDDRRVLIALLRIPTGEVSVAAERCAKTADS
ncbi:hypothetical protein D918_06380 [Trichuris suis]|nr:hypothetical protein D918_06380 [Trichuris suis]